MLTVKTVAGGLLWLSTGCTLAPTGVVPGVEDEALLFLEVILQAELDKALEEEETPFIRYELIEIRPDLMAQRGFVCQAADQGPRLFEAAIDYLNRNRMFVTTDSLSAILEGFEILGRDWPEYEIEQIFEEIRAFREVHPKSPFLTLSLPGFSKDGTVAVILFSSRVEGDLRLRQKNLSGFHTYELVRGVWEKRDWHLGFPYPH